MFSLGSSTESERSYIIFDVGADSVAVAAGVAGPKGKRLLWHKRLEYAFQDAKDYVRYERAMYATLLEVGMSLMSEGFRIAQNNKQFDARHAKVLCVLAPPWFLGTVGTETRTAEKPFEVTQSILDELRAAMYSRFMETNESKSWKEVMGTPQLIEQLETSILFDGYPVHTYMKRNTSELTIHSYLAIVSESVVSQIEEIIHRVLPNQNLIITTSTRVLAESIVGTTCCNKKRVILLEMGGQVTGVAILSHNSLLGVSTVPIGTHTLLRKVAPKAGSVAEALSKVSTVLTTREKIDSEPLELPSQIASPLKEWNDTVQQATLELSHGVVPPRTVVLVALKDWYSLYAEALVQAVGAVKDKQHSLTEVVPYVKEEAPQDEIGGRGPSDERLQAFLQAVDESPAGAS